MRSLLKTVTIASFILAVASGGAFAAEHGGHGGGHGGEHSDGAHGFHDSDRGGGFHGDRDRGFFKSDNYVDWGDLATGYYNAPPMSYSYQGPHHLARVLNEVRVADHRIDLERQQGKLTASSFSKLEKEAAGIRTQALRTADMHRGGIPFKTFATLQGEVRQLDRNIVRMS
ncbi:MULTISPECIES: hypothetical protein [Rhizobium/Agrobacterium group]|uniref:hypothetical protein n=1 Tax=Rhizobium/Agrobacterium group TaxID=227290 RepID=UPI00230080CC|nr:MULTISPECIES: hypothetical protein [Rhizobium/Agrobacterium group]MDA5632168.1 hypothetical protein [Agrobacterium sp. ST15.16.024]MDF1888031.1 hypothetical protein [Rhizobium rhizogenes]